MTLPPPRFRAGQRVQIQRRFPDQHHRVPNYVKGHQGTVERVCGRHGQPEQFVRGNGGQPLHLYRISIPQADLWPNYQGNAADTLEVEIFEHWLDPTQ